MPPAIRRAAVRLIVLAALAACGTPQEQCIRAATREVPTLDRLIAEENATLARGYGYDRREVLRHEWQRCDDWTPGYPHRLCYEPVWETVKVPVAIDPEAEQRKLDALIARRKALLASAGPAIAACKAAHPE